MGSWVTTAVVALALLAAACETEGDIKPRAGPTGPPRSQLVIGEVQSFIPATHKEGSKVVMPVTFPDGSTAEIVYPPAIDIAGMGGQPYSSGGLNNCCDSDFFILFDAIPKSELAGEVPLKVYPGSHGAPVEYWRVGAKGHDPQIDRWLIFRFGQWNVFIHDTQGSMTQDQLATWARSLRGEETSDGFLRLSGEPPLRLAKASDHAGPELLFSNRRNMVIFFVGECQPDPKDDGKVVALGGRTGPEADWFASRCFKRQDIRIHVQSEDKSFAQRVIESVKVRNVELAS